MDLAGTADGTRSPTYRRGMVTTTVRRTPSRSRASLALVLTVLLAVAAAGLVTQPVQAGGADPAGRDKPGGPTIAPVAMPEDSTRDTPLDGRLWGVYAGDTEQWYRPWLGATGTKRQLLDRIARQPKSSWFGGWVPTGRIKKTLKSYIKRSQDGDPDVMVQLAIFRIAPWGKGGACDKAPSRAWRADYKAWIRNAAEAVGDTPAAIVVQPDSPFATQCSPKPALSLRLIRYATKRFAALPRTEVYLETGSADWMHDDVQNALDILIRGGVAYARGFAFNGTHYDATAHNVVFGAQVAQALADRGIPDKHFVINTAQNGAPFRGYEWHSSNYPDNAPVCRTSVPERQKLCVTLGIPPTTDVANPAWGLTEQERRLAARYVDAYLWFGRPWLKNQASPFVMRRALGLARTTPFQ